MNKKNLVKTVSARLMVTERESLAFVNAILEAMAEQLEGGSTLKLQDFGVFTVWKQPGRLGRNVYTGEDCEILPRNSVKFKPGKGLLQRLNKDDTITPV